MNKVLSGWASSPVTASGDGTPGPVTLQMPMLRSLPIEPTFVERLRRGVLLESSGSQPLDT
jgi:hypothetical protein